MGCGNSYCVLFFEDWLLLLPLVNLAEAMLLGDDVEVGEKLDGAPTSLPSILAPSSLIDMIHNQPETPYRKLRTTYLPNPFSNIASYLQCLVQELESYQRTMPCL